MQPALSRAWVPRRPDPGSSTRCRLRLCTRGALVGALTAAVLVPLLGTPVSAADPARQLAAVRADVDRLGNQYFAARQELKHLDATLTRLRHDRALIERSYAKEHRLAVRRAVARYT